MLVPGPSQNNLQIVNDPSQLLRLVPCRPLWPSHCLHPCQAASVFKYQASCCSALKELCSLLRLRAVRHVERIPAETKERPAEGRIMLPNSLLTAGFVVKWPVECRICWQMACGVQDLLSNGLWSAGFVVKWPVECRICCQMAFRVQDLLSNGMWSAGFCCQSPWWIQDCAVKWPREFRTVVVKYPSEFRILLSNAQLNFGILLSNGELNFGFCCRMLYWILDFVAKCTIEFRFGCQMLYWI